MNEMCETEIIRTRTTIHNLRMNMCTFLKLITTFSTLRYYGRINWSPFCCWLTGNPVSSKPERALVVYTNENTTKCAHTDTRINDDECQWPPVTFFGACCDVSRQMLDRMFGQRSRDRTVPKPKIIGCQMVGQRWGGEPSSLVLKWLLFQLPLILKAECICIDAKTSRAFWKCKWSPNVVFKNDKRKDYEMAHTNCMQQPESNYPIWHLRSLPDHMTTLMGHQVISLTLGVLVECSYSQDLQD